MLEKVRYLTAGEFHGKGLLGIIDGIPSSLEISENYISTQMKRRQKGHGRGGRMKIESDYPQIYCGVRQGETLGGPIGIIIENLDYENWSEIMSTEKNNFSDKITLPRPGHADLAGIKKFGFDDIRNVIERSSARETAMRVALSSICRKFLEELDIYLCSRVIQILDVKDESQFDLSQGCKEVNDIIDLSKVRCQDENISKDMINAINKAQKKGDSVGGVIEIICMGLPFGLGSYTQWDKKLQSKISESLMSINAFKGIEFGAGFSGASMVGSKMHDEIHIEDSIIDRKSNNAGGIEGGMSNTQPINIKLSMKPIPTLTKPLNSVDIQSLENKKAHKERTDSCAVPAASIIAENLLCIVIADSILSKFGGDSMNQLKSHIQQTAKY